MAPIRKTKKKKKVKMNEYGLCDCYPVYIPYTLDRSTGPRPKKPGAQKRRHTSTRDGEAEKKGENPKKRGAMGKKIKTLAST